MRDLNLLNQAWPNAVFGLRPRLFFLLIPYIHIFVLHRRFYERERPYHLTHANCTSVVCSYAKPELRGGMSNRFALHTATLRNAQLAGIGEVTGSIAPGKSADFIVTRENPLEDLWALQHLELVVCCDRAVKNPSPKRRKEVDAPLVPRSGSLPGAAARVPAPGPDPCWGGLPDAPCGAR